MMERIWDDILECFGQEVTLSEGEEAVTLHALIQPILERDRRPLPPWGWNGGSGFAIWDPLNRPSARTPW